MNSQENIKQQIINKMIRLNVNSNIIEEMEEQFIFMSLQKKEEILNNWNYDNFVFWYEESL